MTVATKRHKADGIKQEKWAGGALGGKCWPRLLSVRPWFLSPALQNTSKQKPELCSLSALQAGRLKSVLQSGNPGICRAAGLGKALRDSVPDPLQLLATALLDLWPLRSLGPFLPA